MWLREDGDGFCPVAEGFVQCGWMPAIYPQWRSPGILAYLRYLDPEAEEGHHGSRISQCPAER